MNPTFTTILAADFTGEHVSVNDVGALRARAETWEATANTWRAFAVDVARVVGTEDPEDVGIEDLRDLAEAVEQLRAQAEAAEAKAKQAADDHDFLARQIGAAAVASTLAPGESLVREPGETPFFLIGVVERLVARAHAAEATAARLNAANVRLMRRLAPAMGAWKAAADELAKMGRRAVEAEAAVAAAAAAGPITVCDCGVGGPRLCDEDGLCVNCGCDVVVVADQHSADIVAQLRQEREAAEALATARAEVDAAFQQGLTAGQVATCGALSAIAAEVASAGFDETATAIRIAAATLIKADLRLERGPVESA